MAIAKLTEAEKDYINTANPGLKWSEFTDKLDAIIDAVNAAAEIQTAELADAAVTTAKIADDAVTPAKANIVVAANLGTPALAADNTILNEVDPVADSTPSPDAQPDVPRNITITITDANDSASGDVTVDGKDPAGNTVQETFAFGGGTKSFTGTKIFAQVTGITVANVAGAAVGDTIKIGIGNVIGLPTDIAAGAAVKHAFLGGVRVTPDAVATGASTSGVDCNGATYNGSKELVVFYNIGE